MIRTSGRRPLYAALKQGVHSSSPYARQTPRHARNQIPRGSFAPTSSHLVIDEIWIAGEQRLDVGNIPAFDCVVNAVAKCHRHTGDEEQAKGDHLCTSA